MAKLVADLWRGLDFYKPSEDSLSSVLIVGAGAIGSYTAFGLARMGVKHLTVVDHDKVENHNLPNQFFAESLELTDEIFKVVALERTLKLIMPKVDIFISPLRIEAFKETEDFKKFSYSCVVSAVDDMQVRKWIWDNLKNISLLLDARTGGLYTNIFSIITSNQKATEYYNNSLHSNEEASQLPCSGQSIVDVSMATAAELVARYRTYAMKRWLIPIHTFHDYAIGQSYGMAYYEKTVRTDEINNVIHEAGS